MLTIFGIPKPFQGPIGIIQTNAVQSWTRLNADCEVILLGSEPGTAEAAVTFGLRHLPDVERNEYGTPLIHSVFQAAEREATHSILCYVNADIILLPEFVDAVERVVRSCWPAIVIGRRWDIRLDESWVFDHPSSTERLRTLVQRHGRRQNVHAMDYFVFPRGYWDRIPPFAVGRTLWDNWFVFEAHRRALPIVDISPVNMAIHQDHDYGHVPGGGRTAWYGPEAQRNFELLGGADHIYDLRDATWRLEANGVRKVRGPRVLFRQWTRGPYLRPMVRSLQEMKRRWQACSSDGWSERMNG